MRGQTSPHDQSRRHHLRAYLSWRWRCLAHPHYWLQEGCEKLRFPPGSPIQRGYERLGRSPTPAGMKLAEMIGQTRPRRECLPTDEVSSNREGRDCSAESGTGVADIYKTATNPGLHSACRHENGGEGGIRTPGAVTCTTDFESAALNRTRPPLRKDYLFSARPASPRGRCGGAPRKKRARACRSPRPLSLR